MILRRPPIQKQTRGDVRARIDQHRQPVLGLNLAVIMFPREGLHEGVRSPAEDGESQQHPDAATDVHEPDGALERDRSGRRIRR